MRRRRLTRTQTAWCAYFNGASTGIGFGALLPLTCGPRWHALVFFGAALALRLIATKTRRLALQDSQR